MPDFYQILKREVAPIEPETEKINSQNENLGVSSVVDNSDKQSKFTGKRARTAMISRPKRKKAAGTAAEKKRQTAGEGKSFLSFETPNPIWLTLAETAKLGGIQKRTVKRALRAGILKYRIAEKRYLVDLRSALLYFHSKKKLWNKLKDFGLGQYVEKWKT